MKDSRCHLHLLVCIEIIWLIWLPIKNNDTFKLLFLVTHDDWILSWMNWYVMYGGCTSPWHHELIDDEIMSFVYSIHFSHNTNFIVSNQSVCFWSLWLRYQGNNDGIGQGDEKCKQFKKQSGKLDGYVCRKKYIPSRKWSQRSIHCCVATSAKSARNQSNHTFQAKRTKQQQPQSINVYDFAKFYCLCALHPTKRMQGRVFIYTQKIAVDKKWQRLFREVAGRKSCEKAASWIPDSQAHVWCSTCLFQ